MRPTLLSFPSAKRYFKLEELGAYPNLFFFAAQYRRWLRKYMSIRNLEDLPLNVSLAFMPAGKKFHASDISFRLSGPLVRP